MTDKPRKARRAWIGWALFAIFAAFVLYPLSVGPACWVCDRLEPKRGWLTKTYDAVYAPLGWACDQSDTVGGIVLLYIHWWATIDEPLPP
jgi:hypothetical protein